MAESVEKKVLVSAEIVSNFVSTKAELDKLKQSYKELSAEVETLAKTKGKESAEYQTALGNLNKTAVSLAKANNEYKAAKKEIESAAKSEEILNAVGEKANKTLGEMQRELSALKNTPLGDLGKKEADELKQKMADLTDEIGKYKQELKGMDTSEIFTNFTGLAQGASGLIQSFSQVSKLMGEETGQFEKFAEKTTELIALTQALGAVTEMFEKKRLSLFLLNVKNLLIQASEIAQNNVYTSSVVRARIATEAQAKAEMYKQVAMGKGNVVTRAAAAVQWLWNAALYANPVVAITVAILAAVAAIGLLIYWLLKSNDIQEQATKAGKAYEEQQKKTQQALDATSRSFEDNANRRKTAAREELLELKKNGASKEAIAKREIELSNEQSKAAIDNWNNKILPIRKSELKSLQANLDAQSAYLKTLKKGSDEYKEQKSIVDGLVKSRLALIGTINKEFDAAKNAQIEIAEKTQQAAEEQRKKYQDNSLKTLDLQKKFQDEQYKLQDTYRKKDFLEQQKYDAEKFASSQKYEQEKLDMQKRFGQITASEYEYSNKTLKKQQETFQAQKLSDLNKYYAERLTEAVKLAGETVDAQIAEVERKYAEAAQALQFPEPPQKLEGQSDADYENSDEYKKWKEFKLHQAEYEYNLEQEKQAKITEIREAGLSAQFAKINKVIETGNAAELAKYTDNAREKNRVELEMQEQGIAERKAALDKLLSENKITQEQYNREIYEDEAKLRQLSLQQNQINLNTELLKANKNAQAIYEAKKSALEKERELYKDNADEQLRIAKELVENEKALLESRIEEFEKWGGKTMELLGAINELSKTNDDAEVQRYEQQNEQKKEALKKRLESGLISQKQYDDSVAAADKDLDRKKAEIARKQAIRERMLSVFQIGINTAQAIMKIWSDVPKFDFGASTIALTAMVAALGAVQLATVLSTPLPKASRGLLLRGASHAEGGIPIEAEGGEAIINKRSTSMFRPLLSAINEAGGGVKFANGGLVGSYIPETSRFMHDGGYTARQNEQPKITVDDMQAAMTAAVQQLRVYSTVEDIRRADKNYMNIEEAAVL